MSSRLISRGLIGLIVVAAGASFASAVPFYSFEAAENPAANVTVGGSGTSGGTSTLHVTSGTASYIVNPTAAYSDVVLQVTSANTVTDATNYNANSYLAFDVYSDSAFKLSQVAENGGAGFHGQQAYTDPAVEPNGTNMALVIPDYTGGTAGPGTAPGGREYTVFWHYSTVPNATPASVAAANNFFQAQIYFQSGGTTPAYFDNFRFVSSTAVPEPASLGLIGLALPALLKRRRA